MHEEDCGDQGSVPSGSPLVKGFATQLSDRLANSCLPSMSDCPLLLGLDSSFLGRPQPVTRQGRGFRALPLLPDGRFAAVSVSTGWAGSWLVCSVI